MARKKNITLALDDDLIIKARVAAARRQTSLTSFVRRSIQELVSEDRQRARACSRLKSLMRNPSMQVGKFRWTRDEIHDRS